MIALFTLHLGQLSLTVIVCIQEKCKIFVSSKSSSVKLSWQGYPLPMTLPSPPNVFPTKPITAFQTFPNIFRQNKLRPFTFRLLSSPSDKQLQGIITDNRRQKISFYLLSKLLCTTPQVFNSESSSWSDKDNEWINNSIWNGNITVKISNTKRNIFKEKEEEKIIWWRLRKLVLGCLSYSYILVN